MPVIKSETSRDCVGWNRTMEKSCRHAAVPRFRAFLNEQRSALPLLPGVACEAGAGNPSNRHFTFFKGIPKTLKNMVKFFSNPDAVAKSRQ